jgi:hypothetical protein
MSAQMPPTNASRSVRTVAADYTATPADFLIRVDTTDGPVTITLPPSSAAMGQQMLVNRLAPDESPHSVFVAAPAPDSLFGEVGFVRESRFQGLTWLVSDGQGWWG